MKRLGELLVERNAIQQADVDRALYIQRSAGGKLGALLLRTGAISEDVLLETLSDQLGATYLREDGELPENLDVYRFMVDSPIKLEWFLDHATVVWKNNGHLCCIAKDIRDSTLVETFNYFYPGEDITYHLAANHQIDRLLDAVRKERAMEDLFSGDDAKALREMAEEAPIAMPFWASIAYHKTCAAAPPIAHKKKNTRNRIEARAPCPRPCATIGPSAINIAMFIIRWNEPPCRNVCRI